ncbi:MAG: serine protein kinase RIO [Candidatus Bathyarchaeota archaeon]|nr:serine protein kinase RIO [Candidatus Bathyarchaeota archaeon]
MEVFAASIRERIRKKLERQEKSYETEQLMKEKRSEEYEALEEVFDRPTLMTVYDLMNKGWIDEIYGAIKAGKESKLYWGKHPDGKELAIKIYLTVSSEFRKGMLTYITGDPRFKYVKRDTRSLIYTWARKEFRNLNEAYDAKVRVPKPFKVQNNILLMEFIGKAGVSAPLLKEVELEDPERTYKRILLYVKRLYRKAKLVHGDLSEYNIMVWKGKPVIFDVSQAVNLKHPNSEQFLKRDLENLNRYFKRTGVDVHTTEEALRRVTGGATLR